jgi:hypothetical protein
MRPQNTIRSFINRSIRNRLADLQKRFRLNEAARQIIHNEIESASLYWFIQGGGSEADFETKFNGK